MKISQATRTGQFASLLALFAGLFFLLPPDARAKCTPQQYIEFGRQGLTDTQIAQKCKTPFPRWIAGNWIATLKRETYKVEDINKDQRSTSFNPMLEGMKKLTEIAGEPAEKRDEFWIIGTRNDQLALTRIYDPSLNPGKGSASFPFPM